MLGVDEKEHTNRPNTVVTTEIYEIFHAIDDLGDLHTDSRY